VFSGFVAKSSDIKYSEKAKEYNLTSSKAALSNIEGEWSDFVSFDDKVYWQQEKFTYDPMVKMDFTLPSDSLYREDLILFKHGYQDSAQDAKICMEELQRHDRKLREKYKK
jgi:hypothetical protein